MSDYSVNDHVIYKGVGVCRIEAVENRTFDGIRYEDYLKLVPLGGSGSSYYVPLGRAGVHIRRPMTSEEVNSAIDRSAQNDVTLSANARERRTMIETILKEGDCTCMISLIKTIYTHTESCRNSGKKVLVSDESALKAAEKMIYPEFSFVLGISESDVPDYIGCRLGKVSG